jgi:hypothetical protein
MYWFHNANHSALMFAGLNIASARARAVNLEASLRSTSAQIYRGLRESISF